MSRRGWVGSLVLLVGVGCIPDAPPAPDSTVTVSPPRVPTFSPEAVGALRALEAPSPFRVHINEPAFPTKMYLPHDFYDDCPDAIDLLTRTPEEVDTALLEIAKTDARVPTRCRAARILGSRRNVAVVPILEGMCLGKSAEERYVALHLYKDAVRERRLPAPKDVSQTLKLYATESDREVKEAIESFFGSARARAAVGPLLATLKANHQATQAIWALGEIRDPRAVPVIITAFPDSGNKHYNLEALGKLATPEAVDFIIRHLDEYCAPEALLATGSKKALSALRAHLTKLQQARSDDRINLAQTRIAIVCLSRKDPAEPLLALAENIKEDEHIRHDAMTALENYNAARLHPRLLKLFKEDADFYVRRKCVHMLTDSSLEGVTEAMTEALLSPSSRPRDLLDDTGESDLVDALNKRLKTFFREPDDLRKFLENRQARQQ
jgi:hypothetical protein